MPFGLCIAQRHHFGVRFTGHPDPRTLLMPEDMDDTFPLRKDHPLAEIEVLQGEGMGSRLFHRMGASLLDRTICSSPGVTGLQYTLGGAVALGYVVNDAGVSAEWLEAGHYEIELGNRRYAARMALKPLYDPASSRVRS